MLSWRKQGRRGKYKMIYNGGIFRRSLTIVEKCVKGYLKWLSESRLNRKIPLLIIVLLMITCAWSVWVHSAKHRVALSFLEASPSAEASPKRIRPAAPRFARIPAVPRTTTQEASVHKVVKYGQGEGEVGLRRENGETPTGPESYSVDANGNVLVADLVNHRIVIYSKDGTYLRNINLAGIEINDIAVDQKSRVYVFDQIKLTLYQYDAQGALQSSLKLNPADITTRGYFHVANGAIYFADAANSDVLIANLESGSLTAADTSIKRTSNGVHGTRGSIYSINLVKDQGFAVQELDQARQQTILKMNIPLEGVVAATFIGEDQDQRFYIQTERLVEKSVVLEVLTFNVAGEKEGTTTIPENDYAIWTTKLVTVMPCGTIVQFLPQQDQAKLNVFGQ